MEVIFAVKFAVGGAALEVVEFVFERYLVEREELTRRPQHRTIIVALAEEIAYPRSYVKQQYLPDTLLGRKYYQYGENKLESQTKKYWDEIKKG